MRKFSAFFTLCLMLMASVAFAQTYQLPDPSFEDWTGAQFQNNIQPKYWNYSNVSQLGIANFNFAQRVDGRNGGYAMKVEDQDLEVLGIGETSPGYIALGHPWAYVASISAINKATAGTYGGISWTSRPDTMVVWIKRGGSHTADENYNILFYSWVGRSEGTTFKGKDETCSSVPDEYRYDEESDIRIALDHNECITQTAGTQVAEGWIYEKTSYANWTQIKIPIYYFNDLVPEKCNVIFSASNYPNYRANTGLYAGNWLTVDDVELIYSSSIQKLYIGGKEWKGFDPSNTTGVQTYSLGQGVTTIPTIEARRGIGKLTNNKAESATFQGRRLSAAECQINTTGAAVDGAPVTITVYAEDGSSTSTYQIQFVSHQSANPYLASITVDGAPLAAFNAYLTNYNVTLPYGTTTVPVVAAEAQDGASITITQATSVNGTATIATVAQDGTHTQTYTIHFSVAQLSDNTLQDILINGVSLPGFVPSKGTYNVELPLGTTTAPAVTPVSAYPAGAQTITVVSNTLDAAAGTGECKITVTAPSGASKTYTLKYKVTASSYANLAGIALDGVALEGFDPAILNYTISLPIGTTALPAITWTTGDAYQTVTKTEGGVEGTTRLLVAAAAGNTLTYRLNFSVEKSSDSHLTGIALDGEALEGFDDGTFAYAITLPVGTKQLPAITWTAGDEYQTIRLVTAGLTNPARIIVTAGDGTSSTYVLTFTVEKSASALLQNIMLDGVALEGFQAETFNYTYHLTGTTSPRISVVKGEGQMVTISQPRGAGLATITVQPEEGEANVYTILFKGDDEVVLPEPTTPSYEPSHVADLQMIYVGGDSLEGFDPAVTDYSITLPFGTSELPILTATAADDKVAYVIYTQGEPNADAWVRVVAEDSVTTKDYVLHFPVALSSNALLEDIDAGGLLTFDPAQHAYTISVPFGTPFPELYITKAEDAQTIETSYLDCKTRRDVEIVVTAEDGTQSTYEVHMLIPSHPDNVLRTVMGDGWMLDSLTLNSQDTVRILLPYEADTFAISTVIKNYDDQYVIIRDGGLAQVTTLWVYSGRPGDAAKVYYLLPEQHNPYLLTDLTVDGTTIEGFDPNRFDYILPVGDELPTIAATAREGVTVEELYRDTKHYQVTLEYADTTINTYTVWYFYPNDTIPNADFTEWGTAANNNAAKPLHWTVPADVFKSFRGVSTYTSGGEVKKQDATTARLACVYGGWSLGGSLPGMITLGSMSIDAAVANGTSSSCTGGIAFHNTPDYFSVKYRPVANKKISQSHFVVSFNGEVKNEFSGSYNNKNVWLIDTLKLSNSVLEPSLINIVLNAGNSESASALGGSFTSEASSTMDVDWVRIWYNSELRGIIFAGDTILPDADNHFDIALPTEHIGLPQFDYLKGVNDQSQQIVWSNEVAGVRTASIRSYAEDGSYTDYTLTATRPLSTDAGFTIVTPAAPAPARLEALPVSPLAQLYFRTNSLHAKTSVEIVADSVILTVTPEEGEAVRTIYSAFAHDTVRNTIAAVPTLPGTDSTMVDSISTILSANLDLECILLGDDTLRAYSPYVLSYAAYTPATVAVLGVAGDAQQTVTVEEHTALSDGSDLYYIHVRAGNGATRVYDLRLTHTLASTDATLSAILVGGTALADFAAAQQSYTVTLPAHSTLPDIQAQPNDDKATVAMSRAGNTVSLTVTAEDGVTTLTYMLGFTILPSDWSTLTGLMVGGNPLDGFDPAVTNYNLTLPVHTTALPEIGYTKLEEVETVTIDTTAIADYQGAYTLTVTAEDGVTTTVYTVHFSVEKSTNALLSAITISHEPLADFDEETFDYTISLPYGTTTLPEVFFALAEANQVAHLETEGATTTIDVTAEDGVTTHTYTVTFTILPSTNAQLMMLMVNGVELEGFDPADFDYTVTLPYEDKTTPVVTWTLGDEQQTVVLTQNEASALVAVTAGDGVTENEYTIHFVHLLSPDNALSDLRVNGATIEGFHADSTVYVLVYPVGTKEAALLTKDAVTATPHDADATLVITEEADHTITIMVTAPNGDVRVYVIRQTILLSSEARLQMIYLDSVELDGFDPDVFEYEIILRQGVTAPGVTAEALDSLADVEYAPLVEDEKGSYFEIDGVAEDGTRLTYTVRFKAANWAVTADIDADDYLFIPVPGTGCYKAVTISSGVRCAVYDLNGHMLQLGDVPVADPADVEVTIDADGNQILEKAYDGCAGMLFEVPTTGKTYFYVFFDTRTKRVAKGGKFMLL